MEGYFYWHDPCGFLSLLSYSTRTTCLGVAPQSGGGIFSVEIQGKDSRGASSMWLSPLPVSPPPKGKYTFLREGQRLQEGPLFLGTAWVEGGEVRLSLVWGDIEPYSLPPLASYHVECSLRPY